jgi:hypothetical protein
MAERELPAETPRPEGGSRPSIRRWAQARFGLEPVGEQYREYFDRLGLLWGDGFYAKELR